MSPAAAGPAAGSPYARAVRGMGIYLQKPSLRGLLALNLCAAAGAAMVFVNTVVIVRGPLGGAEREVAAALGAFGAGSMAVALSLPWLLDRVADRRLMMFAAVAMVTTLVCTTGAWFVFDGAVGWWVVAPAWVALGMAYAGLVTPGGRLLRRAAAPADLPFLFAAQFSLSHACWLVAYPLAGWVGARWGMDMALAMLALLAMSGAVSASILWSGTTESGA